MFPANVYAARAGLSIGDAPVTPLVPRAVLQVVFLATARGGVRHVPRKERRNPAPWGP